MKFIAIDVETGGLDPQAHSLLEIGLVNQDEQWRRIVLVDEGYYLLSAFAVQMHSALFKEIFNMLESDEWKNRPPRPGGPEAQPPVAYYKPNPMTYFVDVTDNSEELAAVFDDCLSELSGLAEGEINVAGKNFAAFDGPFLEAAGVYEHDCDSPFSFHRRVLDPAILWAEPGDEALPDLKTCLERAGLEPHVAHSGVADALNVVRLVHAAFERQIVQNAALVALPGSDDPPPLTLTPSTK